MMARRNLISFVKQLIRIPSPFGNEHGISEFVSGYLEDAEARKVKGFGPNIVAEKFNDEKSPTILLNAHMDTVEMWKGGLVPRLEGKRLSGLGSADMKAGLAIALAVFKNSEFKHLNLIFAGTVDEEGDSYGAFSLLSDRSMKADICLIPEPTNEKVYVGARGRYVVEIEMRSEGGHGARPSKGQNVISDAKEVVRALEKLKLRTHPKMGKGSYCILKIQGGGDSLSIPSQCVLRVDRHVVPGESKSIIMKDFKSVVDKLKIDSDVRIRWVPRSSPFLEPYMTPLTPIVRRFLSEHRKSFAAGTKFNESVGDYNLFAKRMPTLVFGPKGKHIHTRKEYVDIGSIEKCHRFYDHFLDKLDREAKKK
jgi:acetylornithine deacetylase/succinyl-diaminopimelate desuccinylase-like protein